MSILGDLQKIWDTPGTLVSVSESRFEGGADFVTAYCLRFSKLTANLIADGDFDTVRISFGALPGDSAAESVDVSDRSPWSLACGLQLSWAWELTNQQGYVDGVRLEFGAPDQNVIVELVVAGSQFEIFTAARPLRTAT